MWCSVLYNDDHQFEKQKVTLLYMMVVWRGEMRYHATLLFLYCFGGANHGDIIIRLVDITTQAAEHFTKAISTLWPTEAKKCPKTQAKSKSRELLIWKSQSHDTKVKQISSKRKELSKHQMARIIGYEASKQASDMSSPLLQSFETFHFVLFSSRPLPLPLPSP